MPRIIFFGTPDFVLPVLDGLSRDNDIVAVVTQPPKPVGRKKELVPSPTAQWAKKHYVQAFDGPPKKLVEPLKKLKADVGVLAAYGRILPEEILSVTNGILNIHPSLLPAFRGASPVAAAIASGEKQTGVTIIRLDAEMDHGPIISQFKENIRDDDTRASLRERLFRQAAEVLATILPGYLRGNIKPRDQDHKKATYTTLIKKEHGLITGKYVEAAIKGGAIKQPFSVPFIKNYSLILNPYSLARLGRALDPWPGAHTEVRLKAKNIKQKTKRLKILKAHVEDGKLVLDQVQLEGKNPVSWRQFKQGYPEATLA